MKAALVLVLPLLAVTACSGSSSDKDAKARASYLSQAESVCEKANTEQKALKTPTGVKDLSPYVDAVVRIADETTTALLKLKAPDSDDADLEKHVFTPLHEQLVTGRQYADQVRAAAKKNDVIELGKLLSDPPLQTRADLTWMRKYGFRQCVELADTSG